MKNPVLKLYSQADKLFKEVEEILNELKDNLEPVETEVQVGKITIDRTSSLKQYLYAIGILNSQIEAAKLMVEYEEADSLKETLDKIIEMRRSKKEYDDWHKYMNELFIQKEKLFNLLSNEEKASLIELPDPPSGFNLIKKINLKKK